jgi:hypothetical protein
VISLRETCGVGLEVLDHDPHRWSKTPGKPPETSGIWLDICRHKSPANGLVLGYIPVRLKIVVSPVQVRVSPLGSRCKWACFQIVFTIPTGPFGPTRSAAPNLDSPPNEALTAVVPVIVGGLIRGASQHTVVQGGVRRVWASTKPRREGGLGDVNGTYGGRILCMQANSNRLPRYKSPGDRGFSTCSVRSRARRRRWATGWVLER